MKFFKSIYFGGALAAIASLAALSACQANMDAPEMEVPVASMTPNITISELKTNFADTTQLCPLRENGTPYIIHGRVVSSDASGNIYKSLVIQDETAAMAISLNQSSTYVDYRIGQEIVMNVSGLYIGYYNGLQQLGMLGSPYNGEAQLTFMNYDDFLGHTELNGLPDQDVQYVTPTEAWPAEHPYCIVSNIGQLPTAGEDFRNMQSQLVEFRNVSFVDGGKETFAPYQESVNRNIRDAQGNELIVRNSGYSTFYNLTLPEGTGTVRGILSYYGGAWQLLLRTKYDVIFDSKGQQDDPYTVAEAIERQGNGYAGWTKGFIVGSVKGGVTAVSSNADILFSADAELDNNLVIAASADVTDYTQCVVLQLPQGTDLRKYGNLADNPAVYKKSINVYGTLAPYLGMPGITGNSGSAAEFDIDGVNIGPAPVVGGDGSKDSPYTVAQVLASTVDATDVWVEGYVVGYVSDMTWATSAVFGNQPTEGSTNYTNGTNIILSDYAPGTASLTNSCPVGLNSAVRSTLAISKNAAIYGQKIKVKGELTKYFGMRGLKNVTEYDGVNASETPVTPPVTPPAGSGDGSEEKPFSVAQVLSSTADAAGVWVEGYLVGYVSGMTWSDTAVFGSQATDGSTNYTNATNCILSDYPVGQASLDNSLPAGLKNTGDVRTTLGISKNPSIYGKRVKVKGEVTKYFGMRGVKNVEAYKILD